jgi:SAM-dependent methyltransferase
VPPARNDPFRTLPEPEHGPLLPVLVSYLFSLSGVMRIVDTAVLAWRPRLFRAYLATWGTAFSRTPWADGSFDKIQDARRGRKSVIELTYGETPVASAIRLLRAAGVTRTSRVLDLGCGRGRVLLAARYLGAEARGVDLLESHVRLVREPLSRVGASVTTGDAETHDFGDATHVYLAWTCFSEKTRGRIAERLSELQPGTRVITLNHGIEHEGFTLVARAHPLCSWGRTPAYVYEREA